MDDEEVQMLDRVETDEGPALVVGLPREDQIEVRYPNTRLRVLIRSEVTKIRPDLPPLQNGDTIEFESTETIPIEERHGLDHKVLPKEHKTQSTGTYTSHNMAQGEINPAIAEVAEEARRPASRSTLAEKVAREAPRSKSGRKLTGAALQKAQAKREREG